jgi:hypothetical protein
LGLIRNWFHGGTYVVLSQLPLLPRVTDILGRIKGGVVWFAVFDEVPGLSRKGLESARCAKAAIKMGLKRTF